jgi:FMN phosphatase YigB (HAD superfamily)
MTLTLLLDMDDTLLANDMNRFMPAYLGYLGDHLQDLVAQDRMKQTLLTGTRAMFNKQFPELTLEKMFDEIFYPGINNTKEKLSARLNDFYEHIYPALKSVTSPISEAIDFVEWAFSQNYEVVIATNPLFPRTAIEQRLAWAGLPVTKYPFRLITSFEHFHFAKPNPAYFAEILGQLGWPEYPAVMVGNNLKDDILPARAIGLPAFHLHEETSSDGNGSGSFAQLKPFLKEIEGKKQSFPQTPQAFTALLASTPAAMETLSESLEEDLWQKRPHPKEWSLGEIFCHLRDVDTDLSLPRTIRIQQENSPFLPGEETNDWAEKRHYLQENPRLALQGFFNARTQLLQALESLAPQDWSRPARHAIFGPTTLSELQSFTITHDQNHIRQVAKNIQWLKKE